MEPIPKFKLREPLIILALIFLFIFWAINALNTGNAFWFFPVQPAFQPSRIVVRHYGQTVDLQPGSPGFSELALALNDTFASGFDNNDLVSIGLSEETLRRYAEEELVIESYHPAVDSTGRHACGPAVSFFWRTGTVAHRGNGDE